MAKPRRSRKPLSPGISLGIAAQPALPAWKAFVVQFSRETGREAAVFSGRAEHLGTGQETNFESPQQLVAFVTAVLEERPSGGGDPPQGKSRTVRTRRRYSSE